MITANPMTVGSMPWTPIGPEVLFDETYSVNNTQHIKLANNDNDYDDNNNVTYMAKICMSCKRAGTRQHQTEMFSI